MQPRSQQKSWGAQTTGWHAGALPHMRLHTAHGVGVRLRQQDASRTPQRHAPQM